ncbi:MAG: hypothetical protein AVDCRST_MAG93-9373 [uncultured Chloroflexia bacterium]|uniref:Uncharacterized protein n=1 Tax=uncultured Chloroflexia bacterium TaxID=1672391 RepID=A0A6J4NH58_9CHLR|nr:MAG: hypothetical protein AVDCRST_MAG93-9373 [uncultured Chloroflexia bacterium]
MIGVPTDNVDHDPSPSALTSVARGVGARVAIHSRLGMVSHSRRRSPGNRRSSKEGSAFKGSRPHAWIAQGRMIQAPPQSARRHGTGAADCHAGGTAVLRRRERGVEMFEWLEARLHKHARSTVYVALDSYNPEDEEVGAILTTAGANWCYCLPKTATNRRKEVRSRPGFARRPGLPDYEQRI